MQRIITYADDDDGYFNRCYTHADEADGAVLEDCGIMPGGECSKAGTDFCDLVCPLSGEAQAWAEQARGPLRRHIVTLRGLKPARKRA